MALTIPNYDATSYPALAGPDQRDFDTIVGASGGVGVISGCAVTGNAAMTVAVAAGVVLVGWSVVSVAANASLAITTADATNPRIDVVTVDSAGTLAVHAGAPAAFPEAPSATKDSNGVVTKVALAYVYVPANATTTNATGQIADKRMPVINRSASAQTSGPVSGSYLRQSFGQETTSAQTVGMLIVAPYPVPLDFSCSALHCGVSTAGATGSLVDLAIYDSDANGFPRSLVASVTIDGTIVADAVGTFTAVTLRRSLYWTGALVRVASPTLRVYSNTQQVCPIWTSQLLSGGTVHHNGYAMTGQTSLPSTFDQPGAGTFQTARFGPIVLARAA